jgi:tellurite resistance protein TerC
MEKPLWVWGLFFAVVLVLWILDQGLLHKKNEEISFKQSIGLTVLYMFFALMFGMWVWYYLGAKSGKLFITGYLVEFTLALDNIFAISLIMTYFAIPRKYQHRVLFWGILGAIIFRGIMIALGATLIAKFHWILYFFSAFLIYTGIKMIAVVDEEAKDMGESKILKFLMKKLRVTKEHHGEKFIVKLPDVTGKLVTFLTPAGIAILFIEIADVVFAVDSVPAIFAITSDPYIVYTSNIFAILGLRNLYFALDALLHRFKYLKYSLSIVLIFIGSKIFIVDIFGMDHFPEWISLSTTIGLIVGGVVYSLFKTKKTVH